MNKCIVFVFIAALFLIINFYFNYSTNLALLNQRVFGYSIDKLDDFKRIVRLDVNGVSGFQFEFINTFKKFKHKHTASVVNPHDFKYLMNPQYKVCGYGKKWSSEAPTLVALVISAPGHFEKRMAVRRTWSNKTLFPHMRTVFLIGDSVNKTLNERIKKENTVYEDIVQESFHDTYDNLTLKTVMAFKWSAKYCPQTKFLLKVDDDVLVNSYYLKTYLKSMINETEPLKNTFLCLKHTNASVKRNSTHKYYLSYEEYSEDYFKPYCSGGAYMFTSDLAQSLYERSLYTRKIRMEDAYVGLMAHHLNSTFINLDTYYCWRGSCRNAFKNIPNTYFYYLSKPREVYKGWDLINEHVSSNFI